MSANKSVLIVGGSGFLGTHLALKLRQEYKVFATYHKHPIQIPGVSSFPLHFANKDWVKRLIYTIKPEVVIFAAGSNNLEWAQANERETEGIHAGATGIIAETSEIFAPRFIFISNCYAFDGARGNYRESDITLPGTALGKAKINGENYIRNKCLNYFIIRSSPLFGRGNAWNLSFLDRIRMKLDRREKVELDDNDLHSFAPVHSFTDAIERTLNIGVRNRIFHIGGLSKVTLFEFGQKFAAHFGYDPSLIKPKQASYRLTSNTELPKLDFSLNSTQAVEVLKFKPFLLEEGLDLVQKKLV